MSFKVSTPKPPVSNINAQYIASPLYSKNPNVPVINFPFSEVTFFPAVIGGSEPIQPNTPIPIPTATWFYSGGYMNLNSSAIPPLYFQLGPFYISSGGTYQLCIDFDGIFGNNGIWDVIVDGVVKSQINLGEIFTTQGIYLYQKSIGELQTGYHTIQVKHKSGTLSLTMFDNSIRIVKI